MARAELEQCWACGIPTSGDTHHIIPKYLGGTNDKRNLITLCEPCHNIIDKRRFQNIGDISWFMNEAEAETGPRWARLMLLEFYQFIAFLENRIGISYEKLKDDFDYNSPVNILMTHFISAMAIYERFMNRELVRNSLVNEQRKGYSRSGKRLGKVPLNIDRDKVVALRTEGKTIKEIAGIMMCSVSPIMRILVKEGLSGDKKGYSKHGKRLGKRLFPTTGEQFKLDCESLSYDVAVKHMEHEYKEMKQRIRMLRESGLTLREIATELGCSTSPIINALKEDKD